MKEILILSTNWQTWQEEIQKYIRDGWTVVSESPIFSQDMNEQRVDYNVARCSKKI